VANRFLAYYPCPNESGGYDILVDHDGPASYVNTGTFNTSGDQINASDFGIGGFEDIGSDMLTSDGTSVCEIVPGATVAGATNLATQPQAGQPGPLFQTAVIHWYNSPTRTTEYGNASVLSAKTIRLRIVGR